MAQRVGRLVSALSLSLSLFEFSTLTSGSNLIYHRLQPRDLQTSSLGALCCIMAAQVRACVISTA